LLKLVVLDKSITKIEKKKKQQQEDCCRRAAVVGNFCRSGPCRVAGL
jgi:hypothetical protein